MCAIFGFLNYDGTVQQKTLKKLVHALSVESEVRGKDATGFSYAAGGNIKTYKVPLPAHRLHLYFPAGTKCVMGHTRMETQGTAANNINNHPFTGVAGDTGFALAHNGVIYNDKLLRITKNIPATQIETDSYIAVQLIEKNKKLDFESIRLMAEDVEGTFTFTILDSLNNLFLVKGDSPLFLVHFEKLGLYVYASNETIFTKALFRTKLKHEPFKKIDVGSGEILKINAEGVIEKDKFESLTLFCLNPRWSYDFMPTKNPNISNATYLDELVELGVFAGVSRNEIISLYDCGYSGYEIEELLSEPELLRENLLGISEDNDFTFDY